MLYSSGKSFPARNVTCPEKDLKFEKVPLLSNGKGFPGGKLLLLWRVGNCFPLWRKSNLDLGNVSILERKDYLGKVNKLEKVP